LRPKRLKQFQGDNQRKGTEWLSYHYPNFSKRLKLAITQRNLLRNKKPPDLGKVRVPKPNFQGLPHETVEEFLGRGGRIRRVTRARQGLSEEAILKAIENILARERG
jgi:hypothetical protein